MTERLRRSTAPSERRGSEERHRDIERALVERCKEGHDDAFRGLYRAYAPKTSELYDKWQDPLEQRNVAEDWPEVYEDLNGKAEAYLASRPPPWGDDAPTVEINEMQLNQLRALGYGVQ